MYLSCTQIFRALQRNLNMNVMFGNGNISLHKDACIIHKLEPAAHTCVRRYCIHTTCSGPGAPRQKVKR